MDIRNQIQPDFVDDRGAITKLLDDGVTSIKSVLLITCAPGAVRANHYHKVDSHHVYMLKGSMEYTERPAQAPRSENVTRIVKAGDVVYTPPMTAHVMRFLEESVFIAMATQSRNQEAYEEDTIPIDVL